MTTKVRAWLLDWPLQTLALANCEVVEVVESPEIHRVPFGPQWCRALLYWRERLLALALPEHVYVHDLHVIVVAYQRAAKTPLDYGALAICGRPRQVEVEDGHDCEPPFECVFDQHALRACFKYEDRVVLVPELSALFGRSKELSAS